MVDGESSEWLPPGFREKVKHKNGRKIKYYHNVETGAKFYSKKDVIRATADNGLLGSPQARNGDGNGNGNGLCSDKKVDGIAFGVNEPEWLPEGWVMEEKARQSGPKMGSVYKVYIEWSSGKKFYSKAAVTQYLNTIDHDNTTTDQNEDIICGVMHDNGPASTPPTRSNDDNGLPFHEKVNDLMVKANDSPQWLPEGWTVEEKTRQNGSAKGTTYKVYIDSSSGRKFYSRNAVTKYLNTAGHTHTMPEPNEDGVIGYGKADNCRLGTPQTRDGNGDAFPSEDNVHSLPYKMDDSLWWLPEGWTVEERSRHSGSGKGSNYKVYTHLSSGNKFYSRAAVTRYLDTLNHSNMDVQNNVDNADKSFPDISPQSIFKTSLVGNEDASSSDKNVERVPNKMDDSSHWLPEGWRVEERSRHSGSGKGSSYKVYTHLSSGNKFYSRAAVTRYLSTLNHSNNMDVQNNVDDAGKSFPDISPPGISKTGLVGNEVALSSENNVDHVPNKMDDSSHWLPEGWTVEERPRHSGVGKGTSYKVYTHLSSGNKFYSRPAVTRFLSTVNDSNITDAQNNVDNVDKSFPDISECIPKTSSGHKSVNKKTSDSTTVTLETTAANDLPPGWIKESRISQSGSKTRKELFYTDPVSGYVFRSKLDALRYVQTNDIRSCLCRPFKREPDDNAIPVTSSNQDNENTPKKKTQPLPNEESSGGGISDSEGRVVSKAKTSKQGQGSGSRKQAHRSSANLTGSKKRKELDRTPRTSKRQAEMGSTLEVDPSYLNIEKPEGQIDSKSSEKQLDDGKNSPESQGFYNFGDSWSDPVEFALKTLCGDLQIDDNLPFPGSLNESLNTPINKAYGSSTPSDGCLKPSKPEKPIIFKNEFAPQSEPSPGKRHGALALLQSNPTLFTAPSNPSFFASSSLNGQSSAEGVKKDH